MTTEQLVAAVSPRAHGEMDPWMGLVWGHQDGLG